MRSSEPQACARSSTAYLSPPPPLEGGHRRFGGDVPVSVVADAVERCSAFPGPPPTLAYDASAGDLLMLWSGNRDDCECDFSAIPSCRDLVMARSYGPRRGGNREHDLCAVARKSSESITLEVRRNDWVSRRRLVHVSLHDTVYGLRGALLQRGIVRERDRYDIRVEHRPDDDAEKVVARAPARPLVAC